MSERPGSPEVSIVVVSWNTRELLDRCLATAHASGSARTREVIVVDNASRDGSDTMVETRWPEARLIRNADNRGYAPACNQGLRAARGRFVMALNSDAFLVGDALDALVRRLEADPGLAVVGPRLLNADGSTQWVCARRAPRFLTALLFHSHLPAYVPALRRWASGTYPPAWYGEAHDVEVLSGACMLFRREALDLVGYLDDALVLNFDDVEWSLRAGRAGLRLGYEPKAEVTHLGGQSRAFDIDSTSIVSVGSIFTFWDLAFPPAAAIVLKLNLVLSQLLSMLKNIFLVASPPRRRRLAYLWSMVRQTVALMARPHRSARGGRA